MIQNVFQQDIDVRYLILHGLFNILKQENIFEQSCQTLQSCKCCVMKAGLWQRTKNPWGYRLSYPFVPLSNSSRIKKKKTKTKKTTPKNMEMKIRLNTHMDVGVLCLLWAVELVCILHMEWNTQAPIHRSDGVSAS